MLLLKLLMLIIFLRSMLQKYMHLLMFPIIIDISLLLFLPPLSIMLLPTMSPWCRCCPCPSSHTWSLPGEKETPEPYSNNYGVSDDCFRGCWMCWLRWCCVKLSYNKLSADVNYSGETKYVPGPGYDFLAVGGDTVVDFFSAVLCYLLVWYCSVPEILLCTRNTTVQEIQLLFSLVLEEIFFIFVSVWKSVASLFPPIPV